MKQMTNTAIIHRKTALSSQYNNDSKEIEDHGSVLEQYVVKQRIYRQH